MLSKLKIMETEIYRSSASSSSIEKCGSYSEDADDHILWNVGDLIGNNRYIVRRMLGKGTFGTVLEVIDLIREYQRLQAGWGRETDSARSWGIP